MNYQGTPCTCGTLRESDYYYCNACHAEYEKKRRNSSPDKLEAAREATRRANQKLRNEMFVRYGSKCTCCGDEHREFLTLDHIGGGGRLHMKSLGVNACGVSVYRDLRRRGWPDGYRTLCMNCNWATRNGSVCPHEKQ